ARVISDAIIGLSDGLTVPFALTAGLSAMGNTKVVVYGGMAELIAGAISMGLGGYLGAKSEQLSYNATRQETSELIANSPETVENIITELFTNYGLPSTTISNVTTHLSSSPHLLDFMMRFEHTLPEPVDSRAVTCALTIALGYFAGGFIPLFPYMLVPEDNVSLGLYLSIGLMVIALFVFGYVKTCFVSGWRGWTNRISGIKGGIEMVVVGSVAAGAAMGLVVAFDHNAGQATGGI
ncbi:Ccc1 family, partial [Xylariales sp. PMI_506]